MRISTRLGANLLKWATPPAKQLNHGSSHGNTRVYLKKPGIPGYFAVLGCFRKTRSSLRGRIKTAKVISALHGDQHLRWRTCSYEQLDYCTLPHEELDTHHTTPRQHKQSLSHRRLIVFNAREDPAAKMRLVDALWAGDWVAGIADRFTNANPSLRYLLEQQLVDDDEGPTTFRATHKGLCGGGG